VARYDGAYLSLVDVREMLVIDWAPKGALLYYITWFNA